MVEQKDFFDVFSGLTLNQDLMDLFAFVQIRKITQNSQKNAIRVYITSDRLITKEKIYAVEKSISSSLFQNRVQVKIIEHFKLSVQYDGPMLLKMYKESILLELKNYNIIIYNMFRKSQAEFSQDGILLLKIEDRVTAKSKSEELKRVLEKIFNERCGIPTEVRLQLEPPTESKNRKKSAIRLEQEVAALMENASLASDEESGKNGEETKKMGGDLIGAEHTAQSAKTSSQTEKTSIQGGDISNHNNNGYSNNQINASKNSKKNLSKSGFSKRDWKGGERKSFYGSVKKSDNPNVLYGRDFEDEDLIPIDQIVSEMGEVTIHGQIISYDKREIRNEKTIVMFDVTDFTDTITIKMFTRNEQLPKVEEALKKGSFIKLKGITMLDKFDHEITISSVNGIKKSSDFRVKRVDNAVEKRVELHCHTKMSDMDGVSDAGEIIKRAMSWGHKALAITDHGAVQGFTDALHTLQKVEGKFNWEPFDFKVIYGVEAYLVDDIKEIVVNSNNQSIDDAYVVFDIETTGFSPLHNKIIEIGAVKVEEGKITDRFSAFINPLEPIPFPIEQLTGINDSMVMNAPTVDKVLPEFLSFCRGCILVAHNAEFDVSFILHNALLLELPFTCTYMDTVPLARILLPSLNKYKLDNVAKALNISLENHHRAVDDAACTAEIFVKFIEMLKARDVLTLDAINELGHANAGAIKKMPTYHGIILAASEEGRVNLYRLVSLSHLQYYNRRPRIPKSEFMKYREGLIIGSACEAGELYQAILGGRSQQEIARIVNFYDYLEIQPTGNNMFMIASDKVEVNSVEELQDINRKIVKLGEEFDKPVVATCDVHFLDPEDEVYRRIIMAGKGFKDADDQAPLFLRTTDEMLEEFQYLGAEKAEEVVITNTNKIADMIDNILPVRPDKCPPVIPNSDKKLRDICYNKAHDMYGDKLPEVVVERLERELNSIISNGFAVMYIIAQKLVWKSNDDGYLVGSRGSVGSSFAATMSGITEVNPLPPHYYCSKCHFSDFDSPEVKKYVGASGCDMPDRACPVCGEPLVKAGFDIPFETFLGFKGNKEPDIDLNFSGEYQCMAHDYTEVIFGKGQTFRAGTIGTLAEKTAFGYVKNYFEERGISKRTSEINRIVQGCVGVRRTTGQHPGGIIVLPLGEDINSFTPVQHPANDMNTPTITTHFDYHSIDHNLLKLDILGHDDPTMIRFLEDMTGIDAKNVPLDNQEVMSLFSSTDALGITPEDIDGCPLGSLGIPEFGTDFVIQMLMDTKPQTISDLIRISGLSHGTDVWLGNAQTLIQEGKATISTAICTRDDIMIYLINKGMESELSFTIMESVRKGKGLKEEWEKAMKEADVPDWYIWSCKKIKYMFPKAHAAAYVMMAYRIAYFKVFYPLAYYAAYFSIRASAFDYEIMCQGKDKLIYYMEDYKKRDALGRLTKKEQDTLKDMKNVLEMYARGYEFVPIDIFKAQANRCRIVDGKIMPPLNAIDGMGDNAAQAVVEAAKDGAFLSKDDFRQRTKVSKTVIDLMADFGIFGDLPETNQLSLFDF